MSDYKHPEVLVSTDWAAHNLKSPNLRFVEVDVDTTAYDQGHIPAKIKGFSYDPQKRIWTDVRGINVSLGLPIIRTSVDHGTAFDQAGKGTAKDASLLDAIEYAAKLASAK